MDDSRPLKVESIYTLLGGNSAARWALRSRPAFATVPVQSPGRGARPTCARSAVHPAGPRGLCRGVAVDGWCAVAASLAVTDLDACAQSGCNR